jgi:hypothetical protein
MLLVVAGVTKAVLPPDSALALAGLAPRLAGVAAPIVRVVAALEAGIGAVALVWVSPLPAVAVAASYVAFAAFVLAARRRGGPLATCGCFGGIDTPPTVTHAVIDVLAAGSAAAVALRAPGRLVTVVLGSEPLHGFPLMLGSAVAAFLAFAAMSLLGRVQAASGRLRRELMSAVSEASP